MFLRERGQEVGVHVGGPPAVWCGVARGRHHRGYLLLALQGVGISTLLGCADSAKGDDAATTDAMTSEGAGSAEGAEGADGTAGDGTGGDGDGDAVPEGCENPGTEGATANCLTPTQPEAYYVTQAEYYFDTLDTTAPEENVPDYHPQVARWEWPPWLLLTGYGVDAMVEGNAILKIIDPSTVPTRDCRFFETQPFARCYVDFVYEKNMAPCPIYEEFTFNDAGEMTFIEAWSYLPGLSPVDEADPWGEDPDFPRLANRIPGLGNATGTIDLQGDYMLQAASMDAEVADFAMRAADWQLWWQDAYANAPEDFFEVGCGWMTP